MIFNSLYLILPKYYRLNLLIIKSNQNVYKKVFIRV